MYGTQVTRKCMQYKRILKNVNLIDLTTDINCTKGALKMECPPM